jgi:hypothetical protein
MNTHQIFTGTFIDQQLGVVEYHGYERDWEPMVTSDGLTRPKNGTVFVLFHSTTDCIAWSADLEEAKQRLATTVKFNQ